MFTTVIRSWCTNSVILTDFFFSVEKLFRALPSQAFAGKNTTILRFTAVLDSPKLAVLMNKYCVFEGLGFLLSSVGIKNKQPAVKQQQLSRLASLKEWRGSRVSTVKTREPPFCVPAVLL